MLWAALSLLGVISAGFLVGAVVRRVGDHSLRSQRRPTGGEAVAIGLAAVGAPLFALGIASVASSGALLVPDGAQVQTVVVSAGAITVDPAILRPGQTRFRCHFTLDATPEWVRLVTGPEGVDAGAVASPPLEDFAACISEPGSVAWGTIADLPPGRYVWTQVEPSEVPLTISTSSVFVVAP